MHAQSNVATIRPPAMPSAFSHIRGIPPITLRMATWLCAEIFEDPQSIVAARKLGIKLGRASGEGVNSTGGALVPDDIEAVVMSLREKYGVMRKFARTVKMFSEQKIAPQRIGFSTSYFTAENASLTESSLAYASVGLVAKKLSVLLRSSNDLMEDSAIDLVADFADDMAATFAYREDDCGFNGDGTSNYGGMVGIGPKLLDGTHAASKISAAHSTFGTLDSTDLGTLIAATPARAIPGAAWFVSTVGYGATFVRIAAAGGGLTTAIGADGELIAHYLGWPIRFTNVLPMVQTTLSGKLMLAFGDLKKAVALGDRRGITIKKSALGTSFELDETKFRGTERFDLVAGDLGDATNAGSIVGLFGA